MAGGVDAVMQDQSLGAESNSMQSQSHKTSGLSSGPPSAMRPVMSNQANSQILDQKIDFYNKGMAGVARNNSPGLGGGNLHTESAEAF